MEQKRISDSNTGGEIARLNTANDSLVQQLAVAEAEVKKITTSNEQLGRQLESTRKALAQAKQAAAAAASSATVVSVVAPAAAVAQAPPATPAPPVNVPAAVVPAPVSTIAAPLPAVAVATPITTQPTLAPIPTADAAESSAMALSASESVPDLTQHAQQQQLVSKKRDRATQESSEVPSILTTDSTPAVPKPAPPAGPPPAHSAPVQSESAEDLKKRLLEKRGSFSAVTAENTTTAPPPAARPLQTGPVAKKGRGMGGQPQIMKQAEIPLAPVPTELGEMDTVVSTEEQAVFDHSIMGESTAEVSQPAKPFSAPVETTSLQQPLPIVPPAQVQPIVQSQLQRQQPNEQVQQQAAPRTHPFTVTAGPGGVPMPFGKGLNPFAFTFTPAAAAAPPLEEGQVSIDESSNPPKPQGLPPKIAPTSFLTTPFSGKPAGIAFLLCCMYSI